MPSGSKIAGATVKRSRPPREAPAVAALAEPIAAGSGALPLITVTAAGVPGYTPPKEQFTGAPPTRDADGTLHFANAPLFTPNVTPEEVLRAGAFGGGYFRPITSGVTRCRYTGAWREFPAAWFAGLDVPTRAAAPVYDAAVNRYGVRCGQDLLAWESSGWIAKSDPYGWFMWYCRYFLGRRSDDDARQIGRWAGVAGSKGRWKANLVAKVAMAGAAFDDATVSPVVRQTLLHWGYALTRADYERGAATFRRTGAAPYVAGSGALKAAPPPPPPAAAPGGTAGRKRRR